jgi:hypothetical protein
MKNILITGPNTINNIEYENKSLNIDFHYINKPEDVNQLMSKLATEYSQEKELRFLLNFHGRENGNFSLGEDYKIHPSEFIKEIVNNLPLENNRRIHIHIYSCQIGEGIAKENKDTENAKSYKDNLPMNIPVILHEGKKSTLAVIAIYLMKQSISEKIDTPLDSFLNAIVCSPQPTRLVYKDQKDNLCMYEDNTMINYRKDNSEIYNCLVNEIYRCIFWWYNNVKTGSLSIEDEEKLRTEISIEDNNKKTSFLNRELLKLVTKYTHKLTDKHLDHYLQIALLLNSSRGKVDIVKRLLDQEKINPNTTPVGLNWTPMMGATYSNKNETVVNLLLQHGGEDSINIEEELKGNTPLMLAIIENHTQTIFALLANKNINLNISNRLGETALVLASQHEYVPNKINILDVLLENKTIKLDYDGQGKKTLQALISKNMFETSAYTKLYNRLNEENLILKSEYPKSKDEKKLDDLLT